jgi:hypothetical protein
LPAYVQSFDLPVILAVGLTPNPLTKQAPPPQDPEIVGYAAYYSTCAAVPDNISKIQSWGGYVDTIQLYASQVECLSSETQQGPS